VSVDMDGSAHSGQANGHSNGHANRQQPNGRASHDQEDRQAAADDIEAGEEGGKAAASQAKLNTGKALHKSTLPFDQL
jgi:hypothetical protein